MDYTTELVVFSLPAVIWFVNTVDVFSHRHDTLIEKHQLTPHDCRAVLEAVKQDFLAIMGKLSDGCSDTLEPAESIFVVYYLEAIIILKILQRPGVVEHMAVSVTVLFWSVSINFSWQFSHYIN